jgi:transposase
MRETRGLVRHGAKRRRRRVLLPDGSLVIGLDLGKHRHAAWMIDPAMRPLGKTKLEATPEGLTKLLAQAESARLKAGLNTVVVALEPTSHFWMLVANQLERLGVEYLVVHPISVWRGREIREYSYAKDDFRDASLIAELAVELHFTQAHLKDPLWQEMRSLVYERFGLVELRSRAFQETGSHLEVIFPNYPVFHRLSTASRAVLSGDPDPRRIGALDFQDFVADTRSRYEGTRLSATTLSHIHAAAQASWGLEERAQGSKLRLQLAMKRQRFIAEQITQIDSRLSQLYSRTGYQGIAETMPGMTSTTASSLLGLCGDPATYDSGRCLAKLAGINPRENESGDYKGNTGITRRGNPVLRTVAYRAAMSLARNNVEFKTRLDYLMTRPENRLVRRQAYVALANKMLRVLHTMWTSNEAYDSEITNGKKPPNLFSKKDQD